jgi:hypothetical protein
MSLIQRRQVEASAGGVRHRGQPAVGVSSASRITVPPFSLTNRTVLSPSSAPRKKTQFGGTPLGRSRVPSITASWGYLPLAGDASPSKIAVLYRNSSESATVSVCQPNTVR